jgi:hypothetical protein
MWTPVRPSVRVLSFSGDIRLLQSSLRLFDAKSRETSGSTHDQFLLLWCNADRNQKILPALHVVTEKTFTDYTGRNEIPAQALHIVIISFFRINPWGWHTGAEICRSFIIASECILLSAYFSWYMNYKNTHSVNNIKLHVQTNYV